MDEIIHVEQLMKHFKIARHHRGAWSALRNLVSMEWDIIRAVDGISFNVEAGEFVGYLGPNGAGKSTTIKMLAGLLVPTSGQLRAAGRIPWKERKDHVAQIGAVFGQRTTLWWDLPVIESLDLLQHIYAIPPQIYRQNLLDFRKLLDLDVFINVPVRSLSLGQRMRADLCAAMLHNPRMLFLDEPTIGLDVVAKERIREFIRYVNRERGTTILLTTHDVSDVEKLCERVMIIDHGRLVYDGDLESLRQRFGGKRRLVLELAESYESIQVDGAELVEREGARIVLQFDRDRITASELIGRISAKYRIHDLEVREPDIESTIRRIYEEKLLENVGGWGSRYGSG